MFNSNSWKESKDNTITLLVRTIVVLVILILILCTLLLFKKDIDNYIAEAPQRRAERAATQRKLEENKAILAKRISLKSFWQPNSISTVTDTSLYNKLVYGQDLIAHTAKYLGPKGSVAQLTNGMNCQNCHLDAGTKPWGNNYGSVFATYPKYRARSGTKENIYKRISDCFERSLNGRSPDSASAEMQALKTYIEFIGKNVPSGEKAKASGIFELPFLNREANAAQGKVLYAAKCSSCHQANGEGLFAADGIEYTYPPLWGNHSYNIGAGLYRISRLAGYIKYNMPQGSDFTNPQLSDEEAWDLAAFINSQTRPTLDLSKDWPKQTEKPVDHPFGPFADSFSARQHKLGPFPPIALYKKQHNAK